MAKNKGKGKGKNKPKKKRSFRKARKRAIKREQISTPLIRRIFKKSRKKARKFFKPEARRLRTEREEGLRRAEETRDVGIAEQEALRDVTLEEIAAREEELNLELQQAEETAERRKRELAETFGIETEDIDRLTGETSEQLEVNLERLGIEREQLGQDLRDLRDVEENKRTIEAEQIQTQLNLAGAFGSGREIAARERLAEEQQRRAGEIQKAEERGFQDIENRALDFRTAAESVLAGLDTRRKKAVSSRQFGEEETEAGLRGSQQLFQSGTQQQGLRRKGEQLRFGTAIGGLERDRERDIFDVGSAFEQSRQNLRQRRQAKIAGLATGQIGNIQSQIEAKQGRRQKSREFSEGLFDQLVEGFGLNS